jgi:hypothetical protein
VNAMMFNPSVEQTIRVYCSYEHNERLGEINSMLKSGWQVASVTPAEKGGYGNQYPDVYFLIVFERRLST